MNVVAAGRALWRGQIVGKHRGLEHFFLFANSVEMGEKKISTRTMWVYGVHTLGKRMYLATDLVKK